MPRRIIATAREVQKARAEWYSFHFDNRQQIKAMDARTLEAYRYAAGMITPPQMTVYGGVAHDYPERQAYSLASRMRLDVNLINPWYLSDAGWEQFQKRWAELPEPIDILSTSPCVQVGELYTLSTIGPEAKPPR